ncbi:MAG: hypothetical protein WCY36_01490 [Candidatus Omnitrophota bacterium]
MILVIDCDLKQIKIRSFKEVHGSISASDHVKDMEEVRSDAALVKYIRDIAGRSRIRAVSFRILFGGDYFAGPAIIDSRFFTRFEKLTDLFPFYVPPISHMLKNFRAVFKDIPLIAFFETSFFLSLPDEEKYYAMPFKYSEDNKIKKWGFHGIFHSANADMLSVSSKGVSIVFDKQTTVCAVHNRKPLSVSLGYTPLEGVMSRTSCGDMDPGIVFYLMNVHNFSIYKIDEMLKNESGFVGLTGYNIGLNEMLKLRGKDAKVDLAFDIYRAQIMKYIGEGISVMGGLDDIIFSGSNVRLFTPIIYDVLKKISFLGLTVDNLPWAKDKDIITATSADSSIKTRINTMDLSDIIFRNSLSFLKK